MLENVVYFSGVHGSGKSTLLKELAKKEGFLEHIRIHSVKLDGTYIRSVWRLTKYYIEAMEQEKMSQRNPHSLILGNRCVYDNFAYINAFVSLGWISKEDAKHHSEVFNALFQNWMRPQLIVYIAPSIDWVTERLRERWSKGEKKWREDDVNYLDAVIKAYDQLYRTPSFFNLDVFRLEETNLERRVELVQTGIKRMKEQPPYELSPQLITCSQLCQNKRQ